MQLIFKRLTLDEARAVRNIAFVVSKGHKKEWYLEVIKSYINPNSFDHALGYLDFLICQSELIFSRKAYSKYIRRLKKESKDLKPK